MTGPFADEFPGLPATAGPLPEGPRRIAIASVDIAGPYHCGGVGAAYHGLALALAEAGHQVTILYLHHKFHQGGADEWIDYFRARGIHFVHLPQPPEYGLWYANRKEASFHCYRWLRDQPAFDIIHFHEWPGVPYYSLAAKQAGLAFGSTTLCVGTHGPMRWSLRGDEVMISRAEDLVVDFLERKSVELADVVVSPSQYLLGWMREEGWQLPRRTYVAANLLERVGAAPAGGSSAIRELVFFGRLDRRKGLPFFCDVLDRMRLGSDVRVTFLGGDSLVDGRSSVAYLADRVKPWSTVTNVIASLGRAQALEYLRGAGRLAVIPSQVDNSPCTVQECLQEGVPFLTSDRGGIPELIHPDDRSRVTAPLNLGVFAGRIREILQAGQKPARLAPMVESARREWIQWHAAPAPPPSRPSASLLPRISICVAHFERPQLLERMLESLRRQTYPDMEVVLADDGSSSPDAVSLLSRLDDEFRSRGWRLLRQENAGPGVARDRAATAARGSHLVFADDDDVLLPHAIETFAQAAAATDADAFCCVLAEFEGDTPPESFDRVRRWVIPLGPSLAAGMIYPEFGGTLYMLKRECYLGAGRFSAERDIDEDWELLLRVVAAGFRLQMIPEPLVWYRFQEVSRSRADNRFKRNQSRIRIYEKLLPPELRDLASLAFVRLARAPDSGSEKKLARVVSVLEQLKRKNPERPD